MTQFALKFDSILYRSREDILLSLLLLLLLLLTWWNCVTILMQ